MWNELGFKENPYNTRPLRVSADDLPLLIGRSDESVDFATALESASDGVVIISGVPGVGKTSFLNIKMYELERNLLGFGPKIIAARHLCPIQTTDEPRDIALRAIDSLLRSITQYCNEYNQSIPSNIEKIKKWFNQRGTSKGVQIGITLFGFGGNIGRETTLPTLSDISYETLLDLLNSIIIEGKKELETEAFVIVLDNLENLEEEFLGDVLMTFRDTLFSIDHVYWILIGQSGLGSLIQTLDQRVFQRITHSLELSAITAAELKTAMDVRIRKFHKTGSGKSPVSENIYQKLYNCSNGEIRFVFKYCSAICISFAQEIRKRILKSQDGISLKNYNWDEPIGEFMIENELLDSIAEGHLRDIVQEEFNGLNLKPKDKEILAKIGEKKQTRAKEFRDFNMKTMQDFSSNYLTRFATQGLLLRKQEGRAVLYELRGLSLLAKEYGLLD